MVVEIRTADGNVVYQRMPQQPQPRHRGRQCARDERDAVRCRAIGHGSRRRGQRPRGRRQDRHQRRLPRCMVHRLFARACRRRVGRQRRFHADEESDRRRDPGADLERLHAGRAQGHEADAAAAGRADHRTADRAGRRRRQFLRPVGRLLRTVVRHEAQARTRILPPRHLAEHNRKPPSAQPRADERSKILARSLCVPAEEVYDPPREARARAEPRTMRAIATRTGLRMSYPPPRRGYGYNTDPRSRPRYGYDPRYGY